MHRPREGDLAVAGLNMKGILSHAENMSTNKLVDCFLPSERHRLTSINILNYFELIN